MKRLLCPVILGLSLFCGGADASAAPSDASGMLADALHRYAAGVKPTSDLDKAVAKRFSKLPKATATVKRILAAAPKSVASVGTTKAQLAASDAGKMLAMFQPHRHVSKSKLPAEGMEMPTSFQVDYAGLTCTKAGDGDGDGDEPMVLTSFIHVSGGEFVIDTVASPASGTPGSVSAGGTRAERMSIVKLASVDALLVSAVVEDDGGDSSTARAEYDAMLAMAASMTDMLDGDDRLAELEYAIAYARDVMAMSQPVRWGGGAVTMSRLFSDAHTKALADLYATAPDETGGISWKVRHDHATDGGAYGVLFDVPAPPQPKTKTAKVRVLAVRALDPDAKDKADLTVEVSINGATAQKFLPEDKDAHAIDWNVTRRVLPGKLHIRVEVAEHAECHSAGGIWALACMGLPLPTVLDAQKGAGKVLELVVDPTTGTIRGGVDGKTGATLTVAGGKDPRAHLQLQVTVQ